MTLNNVFELKGGFYYAMHGGGAVCGKKHTNSKDAIDYWYKIGKRIFEFDLAPTSDGHYVAIAHHLNKSDLNNVEIYNIPSDCTEEWFLQQHLYGRTTLGLTPLSLKRIIEKMEENPDVIVMLDLYGIFSEEATCRFGCELDTILRGRSDILNRLLVEVYCPDMIRGIRESGNQFNLIYGVDYGTIENYGIANKTTPDYLKEQGVGFVSYPLFYSKEHPGELDKFVSAGFCMFCRTSSNVRTDQLKKIGIHVNLIDTYYEGKSYYWHKFTEYSGIDTCLNLLTRIIRKIKRTIKLYNDIGFVSRK